MVTENQPPTAAVISFKVNLIKNPDREYNNLVNKLKLDKDTVLA